MSYRTHRDPSQFTLGLALLILPAALGCSGGTPPAGPAATPAKTASTAEEHHHGSGPHGGTVADWGGGTYHVEFTVDHDKKESTVYVLGSDGKSLAPIKADKLLLSIDEPTFQVDLLAQPQPGEAAGTSSRFGGKHDNLGIVREFSGTIGGDIGGTPYAGDFKETAASHTH